MILIYKSSFSIIKLLILVLSLFYYSANAQQYRFDFLAKYSGTNSISKSKISRVHYFNTDDFSYYLTVSRYSDNKLHATLFDKTRSLIHRFNVVESTENQELQFHFKYIKTETYHLGYSKNSKPFYRFVTADENKNIVDLLFYNSKRYKKVVSSLKLYLKPANKNLFPVFNTFLEYNHPNNDAVVFNGNYIVTAATYEGTRGTIDLALEEYQNINFDIVVNHSQSNKNKNRK